MTARAAATFFVDTSCIIAAVCAWHQRHREAAAQVERRLVARQRLATAAHALAEAYAVLTRFPAPHRLSPADALALLEGNFIDGVRIVALDADGYRSLLRRAAKEGISGGRTYDAVIAECALKAKASVLLTFNAGHFANLDASGVRIVVPAVESRQ
ncbi:MAG: PIN domain-containing protein [Betaproteobacteria bacterium]|nr:PIN domain-containing protein [Betaproteobacteria bacterium]